MVPVHPLARPKVLRDTLSVSIRGEEICDAQLVREVDPEEPRGRDWVSWDFYGISMDFMGFLLDFYGISIGFLWDFYWISMGFLWDFYGISIGFLWDFYGISMGFMGFLRVLVGFLWLVVRFLRFFWTDLLKFLVRSVEVNQVVIWEMVVHACPIFVLEKSWNCHGCRGFDIDSFITQF